MRYESNVVRVYFLQRTLSECIFHNERFQNVFFTTCSPGHERPEASRILKGGNRLAPDANGVRTCFKLSRTVSASVP